MPKQTTDLATEIAALLESHRFSAIVRALAAEAEERTVISPQDRALLESQGTDCGELAASWQEQCRHLNTCADALEV